MSAIEASFIEETLTRDLAVAIRRTKLIAFDFDGVFTNNTVFVMEDGREAVQCCRADGLGLAKLARLGVEPIVISTEINPVVEMRSRKLGLACFSGSDDKLLTLQAELDARGLMSAQAAFVGNDINDLSCLEHVGLPIVVRNAHPDVVSCALYRTRRCGGEGAVREVCDLFDHVLAQGSADGGGRD